MVVAVVFFANHNNNGVRPASIPVHSCTDHTSALFIIQIVFNSRKGVTILSRSFVLSCLEVRFTAKQYMAQSLLFSWLFGVVTFSVVRK